MLFKEVEDNQAINGEVFSLFLTNPSGKISEESLKMLLEGIVPKFIEDGRLDFADRDNFVFKFTGKSSYPEIIYLIIQYEKLLVSQAHDIYGTEEVKLSFKENAVLEEVNAQLGGEVPELLYDIE